MRTFYIMSFKVTVLFYFTILASQQICAQTEFKEDEWNNLLDKLYFKLSRYEYQKDVSLYNVADINDWGKEGKHQGLVINDENFPEFVKKVLGFQIPTNDLSSKEVQEINDLLEITLRKKASYFCDKNNTLHVQHDYVKTSEIKYKISNPVLSDSCKRNEPIRKIVIVSSHTVFFDESLEQIESVIIIAPNWVVIGPAVSLDLRGADAPSNYTNDTLHWKVFEDTPPKTKFPRLYPRDPPKDTLSGLPGESGGSFFGIGEHFVNGKNLTIDTSGGQGGSDRKGNATVLIHNYENKKNDDLTNYYKTNLWDYHWSQLYNKTSVCKNGRVRLPNESGLEYQCEVLEEYHNTRAWSCEESFIVYNIQKVSQQHGGYAGDGGPPGMLSLITLKKPSQILKTSNSGRTGPVDRDPKRSQIRIEYSVHVPEMGGRPMEYMPRIAILFDTDVKFDIINAINFSRSVIEPESGHVISRETLIDVVLESKKYLREQSRNRFRNSTILQFLKLMDENDELSSLYSGSIFLRELQDLEQQYNSSPNYLLPHYQSLMKKLEKYFENPVNDKTDDQTKLFLNYMMTLILSRVQSYDDSYSLRLMTDKEKKLENFISEVGKLANLIHEKNKFKVLTDRISTINGNKTNFTRDIEAKLTEAERLIQNQLLPELGNINNNIDEDINKLLEQVIQQQKDTKGAEVDLIAEQEKLKKNMLIKGTCGVIKTISTAALLVGPAGILAGTVVGSVTTVSESLLLGDASDPGELMKKMQANLKRTETALSNFQKAEVFRLGSKLEKILGEINKIPKEARNSHVYIPDLKPKLVSVKTLDDLIEIRDEVKKSLQSDLEEVKKDAPENKTPIKILNFCLSLADIGEGIADTYMNYKNDQKAIEALDKTISDNEETFNYLKKYEKNIHSIMIPFLKDMEADLLTKAEDMKHKSQAALASSKWEITKTLKRVMTQVQQIVNGIDFDNINFQSHMEDFIGVMETLINVNSVIEEYKNEKKLGDYIGNIALAISKDLSVSDQFPINVTEFDIKISTSFILRDYKLLINSFKQSVFPLAHEYLKNIEFSSKLRLDNPENMIPVILENTELLLRKLRESRAESRDPHGCVVKTSFRDDCVSTTSFVEWKNENNKLAISKLLAGDEVIMMANIKESPYFQYAIKFNIVQLVFTSKNTIVKEGIEDILRYFTVNLTHMGDSYYQYDGKYYLMTTPVQSIKQSFEKMRNDKVTVRSEMYEQIEAGDPILSPYATWKIQLRKIDFHKNSHITFANLTRFENDVSLNLEGHGSYVDDDTKCRGLNVDKYYKPIEVFGKPQRSQSIAVSRNKRSLYC